MNGRSVIRKWGGTPWTEKRELIPGITCEVGRSFEVMNPQIDLFIEIGETPRVYTFNRNDLCDLLSKDCVSSERPFHKIGRHKIFFSKSFVIMNDVAMTISTFKKMSSSLLKLLVEIDTLIEGERNLSNYIRNEQPRLVYSIVEGQYVSLDSYLTSLGGWLTLRNFLHYNNGSDSRCGKMTPMEIKWILMDSRTTQQRRNFLTTMINKITLQQVKDIQDCMQKLYDLTPSAEETKNGLISNLSLERAEELMDKLLEEPYHSSVFQLLETLLVQVSCPTKKCAGHKSEPILFENKTHCTLKKLFSDHVANSPLLSTPKSIIISLAAATDDLNVSTSLAFGDQELLRKLYHINCIHPRYVVKQHNDKPTQLSCQYRPILEINLFQKEWFFVLMRQEDMVIFSSPLFSINHHFHYIGGYLTPTRLMEMEQDTHSRKVKMVIRRNLTLEYQAADAIRLTLSKLHFSETFWNPSKMSLDSYCPIGRFVDCLPPHLISRHFKSSNRHFSTTQ